MSGMKQNHHFLNSVKINTSKWAKAGFQVIEKDFEIKS